MPYISPARGARTTLASGARSAENSGELTFLITLLIIEYIENKGLDYQTITDVLGSLKGAELDLNRRIIAPYEQRKQYENGDAWPIEVVVQANGRV